MLWQTNGERSEYSGLIRLDSRLQVPVAEIDEYPELGITTRQ